MIVARLIGGLGNQMFQYAMGCALAARHGTGLALDLRLYREYRRHGGFELADAFGVPESQANARELWRVLGWRAPLAVVRRLESDRAKPIWGSRFYRQRGTAFDPAVHRLPKDCYVSGYWQSERFFGDCKDLIRRRFTVSVTDDRDLRSLAGQIDSCTAVSVHVRRGDYGADPQTLAVHGLMPIDYYSTAFAHMKLALDQPTFFFFSDDMDWVRRSIPAPSRSVYVSGKRRSFQDMRLMSLCRHHVIANSSFSWWGAWLNPRPDKLVIAPRQWFSTPRLDARDICPDDWVRI